MAMNSSIKNSRLLITGTLLHHKHQLRHFFNSHACLQHSVCIYRHNLDFSLGQFPKFASLIA